jgi:hypothetical protein
VFAHYFGLQSDSADAFMAAFRIPNFLQNLFGEGALSASFIPVYAALLARGDRKEATRVAGAVASLLALITAVLVLLGVWLTPALIALTAPTNARKGPRMDRRMNRVSRAPINMATAMTPGESSAARFALRSISSRDARSCASRVFSRSFS